MWCAINSKNCGLRKQGSRGFTLMELLVSLAVFSLVATGITFFGLESARLMGKAQLQLDVTQSKRGFSDKMIIDGVDAYDFRLYAKIDLRDEEMTDGMIGNFLVLFYQDPRTGKVTRTVSYYKDFKDGKNGPVYRYIKEFKNPVDPNEKLDVLLPSVSKLRKHSSDAKKDEDYFIGPSTPLFKPTAGAGIEINKAVPYGIFFNYFDKMIIMRGDLLPPEGSSNKDKEEYNIVISPR